MVGVRVGMGFWTGTDQYKFLLIACATERGFQRDKAGAHTMLED